MRSNYCFSLLPAILFSCVVIAQTTTTYTTSSTWIVPANVNSISIKVWGGGGGTGGQDCGAGCTNPAASNAGFVQASFTVSAGNIVGIYPGGKGVDGSNSVTNTGGGLGGVATYTTSYNGGKGGNAGPTGSSGGGGGGGAASVVTISTVIKVVAAGAGGGGGMANLAGSGLPGSNTYSANGTSNTGGAGAVPGGDGGGGGGGGGGSFGALGGALHAANTEQAGDGGRIGNNLISGASTTTTNGNIAWTTGGRIDITYLALTPVTWLDVTASKQGNNTLLQWSTAKEQQTSSFAIQRSADGINFTDIGSTPAAGNSDTRRDYQFTDKTASGGVNYYRLAQIDLDGKVSYSKTVVAVAATGGIRVYPNPVTGKTANIYLSEAATMVVYDSHGATLMNRQMPAGYHQLDVGRFVPGIYFLKAGKERISFVVK